MKNALIVVHLLQRQIILKAILYNVKQSTVSEKPAEASDTLITKIVLLKYAPKSA